MKLMPAWVRDMLEGLASQPQEMTVAEIAKRIHEALETAEVEKYATEQSKFTFTLFGATLQELDEIRGRLTARENELVELRVL